MRGLFGEIYHKGNAMKFGYYPGCALHGSSNDYEDSLRAVLKRLDVQMEELDDWLCCGATAAHALNYQLSVALPTRNLAIAERDGYGEVLAPCPLCSMELIKSKKKLSESKELRAKMSEIVELSVTGSTEILNLIQLFHEIGMEQILAKATGKLESLRPACYYGCLMTRPGKLLDFDDVEQPSSMDKMVEALGTVPVEWNCKTECCGAGTTMSDPDTVLELARRILQNAVDHGANCIVVACPMCHVNLDMKQSAVNERYGTDFAVPIYYLSDLIGLSMGIGRKELALDRHFVKVP